MLRRRTSFRGAVPAVSCRPSSRPHRRRRRSWGRLRRVAASMPIRSSSVPGPDAVGSRRGVPVRRRSRELKFESSPSARPRAIIAPLALRMAAASAAAREIGRAREDRGGVSWFRAVALRLAARVGWTIAARRLVGSTPSNRRRRCPPGGVRRLLRRRARPSEPHRRTGSTKSARSAIGFAPPLPPCPRGSARSSASTTTAKRR